MIILTRTFDLLTWILPKAKDFPKLYNSTVTQRMMTITLEFQEALYDAQSQGGTTRLKQLRVADAHLNKLRFYLRLVHHWHWINDGQYRHVSVMVNEIGRLLGGWIISSS
jgi:hypothetical protein